MEIPPSTKAVLDSFSNTFKVLVAILVVVLVAGLTYAMYAVGGDWKTILVGSAVCLGLMLLSVVFGLRCGRDILTDKEKEDLVALEKLLIMKSLRKLFSRDSDFLMLLRLIVIMANFTRWATCLLALFVAAYLAALKDLSGGFFLFLFIAILWFPAFDKVFLKKWNYVVIALVKFAITSVAITLMGIMNP